MESAGKARVCDTVEWAIYPEKYHALTDWFEETRLRVICSGKSSATTWTNRFSEMNKALEQKLVERWPTWFNTGGDIRQTAVPLGFCNGDGRFDIPSPRAGLLTFEHQGCPEFERGIFRKAIAAKRPAILNESNRLGLDVFDL